jgi:hypothetical protein
MFIALHKGGQAAEGPKILKGPASDIQDIDDHLGRDNGAAMSYRAVCRSGYAEDQRGLTDTNIIALAEHLFM